MRPVLNPLMVAIAAITLVQSAGCGLQRGARTDVPPTIREQVPPTAFHRVDPIQTPATQTTAPPASPTGDPATETPLPPPVRTVFATPGPPSNATGSTAEGYIVSTREGRVVIDTMIGQINGEPIYAEQFLAPLDSFLRAEAERLRGTGEGWQRGWIDTAAQTIQRQLRDMVRDELILADFFRSVGPDQEQGVLAFVDNIRSTLVSQNLGSEELANRRLLEDEGIDISEKVEQLSEAGLVRAQLERSVFNKVDVSYAEVVDFYNENPELFDPPALATLRVLQVTTDPVRNQEIAQAIARGDDFADLAAIHSAWKPDEDNLQFVELDDDGFQATQFWGRPELQELTASLTEGDIGGPVELGRSSWWIHLEELDLGEPIELFQAQVQIERNLREQKLRAAEDAYIDRLLARANVGDLDRIIRTLLEYSVNKYLSGPRVRRSG